MTNRLPLVIFVSLMCVQISVAAFAQDKHAKMKVSAFAPAKDTETQLRYFVQKIGKDLSDKEEFGEAQQKRIGLDASTVAVLALTLGMHDEESELKHSASKLIELASELVDSAESFDDATTVHGSLSKAQAETKKLKFK